MQDGYAVRSSSPDIDYESDDDADDVGTDGLVVPPSHIVNERAIWLEQQQAGQVVLNSNSKQLLNDMLDEVYAQLQPKRADWDARQSVILFITKFVNHKIPGSSISAFGSFVMDLFTSSSDLDLSLNLADWKCDRSRNDKVHYLRKVAKALYGLQNGLRQSVQKIETVYRAAVPVVKFVEFKTGIECDISVENNDGVLKSRVLGMFSTMDSRFRQLCYLVKAWAKKHNVNSSKNGTLNSLSICLLVAFHLQTCSPPIFPPFSVFMEGLHLPSIGSCLQLVESRVQKYKNEGFGKRNTESVPELFGSFFLKLIAVESLWGQGLCSSTYEGRWISKIWPKNHIGCISVEDFADRSQNVARSVSRKEFDLIYQVLQSTVSNLKDPVLDVLEAKDLKTYLFGSIKQKHRGVDHDLTASTGGNWQSGNDWSSSGDKRFNTAASKGQESAADRYFYADGSWGGHKVSTPVYVNHFQGGRGPGQRANAYRKVERSTRPTEVDPNGFDSNGHRDASAIHPTHLYRVQYPPPNSRSQPMGGMGQGPMYRGPSSFRDPRDGLGQEAFSSQYDSLDPNCNGGYVHREGDFPSIDADRGGIYPETLNPGFSAAVPPQAGRPTYAAIGHGQGRYHSGPAPGTPSGQQRPQKPERDRRGGQRGRRHQPPGGNRHAQQQYTQNGYPIHGGGGEQWAAKPSDHQFLIR